MTGAPIPPATPGVPVFKDPVLLAAAAPAFRRALAQLDALETGEQPTTVPSTDDRESA